MPDSRLPTLPPELAADASILWRLLRGQPRNGSHAERLQQFYAPQASRYDAFRARLLHGRADLITALDIPAGAHVIELGCGTGSNLDLLGARREGIAAYASLTLVDLCPALLELARQRAQGMGNVAVIEADATTWQSPQPADCVFLCYSLSMMPDWRATLDNAWRMLAPGGRLGLVDFHLPRQGGRFSNRFWRYWFAHDGVRLSADTLPALQALSPNAFIQQRRAPVPYLPRLRAPYYLYVGRKAVNG
jgi:S-adenosylmethionine-diacylgycerolhomoserine-N-methlytransferase